VEAGVMENAKNVVQSVVKAFAVLRAFGPDLPELTITDIAGRTGLDRGTAFRLLHTLRELGYIAAVPDTRRFRLTLKCLELGYTPLVHADLKMLSRPLLAELVAEIADAASLGMIEGGYVVYVERAQSEYSREHFYRPTGSRTGIYASALGLAILAYETPDRQREALESLERVKLSERTITDIDALLERLAQIRARGWAFSDGENRYGLRTVAAPVFDQNGRAVAAVSATVDAERYEIEGFVAAAVPKVLATAGQLTEAVRLSFGDIVKEKQKPERAPAQRVRKGNKGLTTVRGGS
jgi:IclR family transcriptional regulator, pca regulon regulatory protein